MRFGHVCMLSERIEWGGGICWATKVGGRVRAIQVVRGQVGGLVGRGLSKQDFVSARLFRLHAE